MLFGFEVYKLRRQPESNRRITVLQTVAFPLRHAANYPIIVQGVKFINPLSAKLLIFLLRGVSPLPRHFRGRSQF